ncbi:amidohydrolase [Aeromicrobium sp. A1-2]|uniref:amidohydrolase family protein n=1 Tax=Aeromicrobium sp. A1-2 TaxID=2107713 RepID=UPI000E46E2AD|nr:amidohydrolase family protein [Aeromicrobium sp. A1-2]AXT84446.1 amidohydrolase [Aeromicrobium sp. A1-2]
MIVNFRVRLPQELRPEETLQSEFHQQYDAVLDLSSNRNRTFFQLQEDMAVAAVDHAVVHAEYEDGDPADALNEAVAKIVNDDPQHFSGFGTISMEKFSIRRATQQVEKVASLGLSGVAFQPSFAGMPMDDRLLYPVYAKAAELGLPVALHTGVNYTTHRPLKNEHPLQLDQVACDFPELTLIACHAGWPWVPDLVAVMRKHPSVFAEFGGLSPKYVLATGTGWEVMHRFMNSLLAEQVLFGTDWPVFPMDRALAEWSDGDLKPHVLRALTGGNAERMLGLG